MFRDHAEPLQLGVAVSFAFANGCHENDKFILSVKSHKSVHRWRRLSPEKTECALEA